MRDLDPSHFWSSEHLEYQQENYIEPPLTPEIIASAEGELGYTLPESYIKLMDIRNGGCPIKTYFSINNEWVLVINGVFGIGNNNPYSLCGSLGSQFMIDEWGYPPVGIYFADTPTAGHDMFAFDYRECGPQGEPCVVHVDQEADFEITWLAASFETFIKSLVSEDEINGNRCGE